MDFASLPIIDWDLSLKLAGNQRALAEDMLNLLTRDLPTDLERIKLHHNQKDDKKLLQEIHKLHGAVSYCGLPRLKYILAQLESELKNHIMVNLPSLLNQLDTEVIRLLEHFPRPDSLKAK